MTITREELLCEIDRQAEVCAKLMAEARASFRNGNNEGGQLAVDRLEDEVATLKLVAGAFLTL